VQLNIVSCMKKYDNKSIKKKIHKYLKCNNIRLNKYKPFIVQRLFFIKGNSENVGLYVNL